MSNITNPGFIYGIPTIMMSTEDESNEFKAFSFQNKLILNIDNFNKCKNDDSMNVIIKEKVNEFLTDDNIDNCIKNMLDKYLCNYLSCFYNNHNNDKNCNLYFGVNDDGIEVGIPFNKNINFEYYIKDIIREKLLYYTNNDILVLANNINNKPDTMEKIPFVVNIVDKNKINEDPEVSNNLFLNVDVKRIDDPEVFNYFVKNNSLRAHIKQKRSHYKEVIYYQREMERKFDYYYQKAVYNNYKVVDLLFNDFRLYSYWTKILTLLGINNVDNIEIFKVLLNYKEAYINETKSDNDIIIFIKHLVHNYKKTIDERINIINTNYEKEEDRKILNKNNQHIITKINSIFVKLNEEEVKKSIIHITNKQKLINQYPKPEKRYMQIYNSNITDYIKNISDNFDKFNINYVKTIKKVIKLPSSTFVINNFENIVPYVSHNLYVVKITLDLSKRNKNTSLLFKKIIVDPSKPVTLEKSTRTMIGKQISCKEDKVDKIVT